MLYNFYNKTKPVVVETLKYMCLQTNILGSSSYKRWETADFGFAFILWQTAIEKLMASILSAIHCIYEYRRITSLDNLFCSICREGKLITAKGSEKTNALIAGTDNIKLETIKLHEGTRQHQSASNGKKKPETMPVLKSPAGKAWTSLNKAKPPS